MDKSQADVHRSGLEDNFASPEAPPDEGYWKSLLLDDEITCGTIDDGEDSVWKEYHYDSADEDHEFPIASIADWEKVEKVFDNDEIVTLDVIGYNRGGLLVRWGELRGFVPASQLVDFPSDYELDSTRNRLLTEYVGKSLRLRVIELERYKNRLILSERAAQTDAGARDELLHSLKPGDRVSGTVTNLCSFGAFVDLGGVEGLIHISELSWGRVRHPSDILERGDVVTVTVLDVEPEDGRIVLSLKRLQEDPWKGVEERYQVDQEVSGVVTNVVDFGAFVCIEEGLEGLVHISELAEGHFLHPYNVVHEGDQVRAKILHIDGPGRRLGLSLRQAKSD